MTPAKMTSIGPWPCLTFLLISVACGATESKSPAASGASAGGDTAAHDGSNAAGAAAGGNGGRGPNEPNSAGTTQAGGPSTSAQCGDVADPQSACPQTLQLADAGCSVASLCDYDTCGDGCNSTFACSPGMTSLSGPTRVCGSACDALVAEANPWLQSRTLIFVERSGTCGAIDGLTLDAQKNQLGALPCKVTINEQQGCRVRHQLDCALDGTQLMLDLRVAFRPNRGWRGEATMETSGAASVCASEYWVAL
jgi:hypothetical protein